MAAPMIAMGAMAAANVAGGIMAGRAASKAAKEAAAAQEAAYREAVARMESVGIPSIEAQKIALQMPEFAGLADNIQLGDTELAKVSTESSLAEARKNALRQLQERSTEGLTTEDKLMARQLRDSTISRQQSADQDILRSMAERGTLDSGTMLAQRLLSNQGAAQSEERAAMELAGQASQNRQQAIMQAAGLAGQIEQDQYARGSQLAQKRDARAEINAANTMGTQRYNLGRQDAHNVNRANLTNQQEMYNRALIGQNYDRENQRATNLANMRMGHGAAQANNINQRGQGQANMWSGIGAGVGSAFGAMGQANNNQLNRENDLQIAQLKYASPNQSKGQIL